MNRIKSIRQPSKSEINCANEFMYCRCKHKQKQNKQKHKKKITINEHTFHIHCQNNRTKTKRTHLLRNDVYTKQKPTKKKSKLFNFYDQIICGVGVKVDDSFFKLSYRYEHCNQ